MKMKRRKDGAERQKNLVTCVAAYRHQPAATSGVFRKELGLFGSGPRAGLFGFQLGWQWVRGNTELEPDTLPD